MASTDVGLVTPEPQNGFITGISQFAGVLGDIGQQAANVYSTFLGAQATARLAAAQSSGSAYKPTQSQLDVINAQQQTKTANMVIYAGIALALLGGGIAIYKWVK